jgi:nucleoside-diphosphate-sugar epimerase
MRRKPTLLIVGCGDVGLRVLRELRQRGSPWRVLALTSTAERRAELRAAGAVPVLGNLDDAATLGRLAGVADAVLHLAPPPLQGRSDPRTAKLLQALSRRRAPQRLVYMSTTGVYGDCQGQWVPETRAVNPQTDRAQRRVDAEQRVRRWARHSGCCSTVLRVPGIYALDRVGGDPRERGSRAFAVGAAFTGEEMDGDPGIGRCVQPRQQQEQADATGEERPARRSARDDDGATGRRVVGWRTTGR